MTLVEDADTQLEEATRPRRTLTRAWAALPWLVVFAALVAAWLLGDVPGPEIVRYLAYWLLCLLLPGTLVHRALRGSRGNLAEDLAYGAATGLVLEAGVWATAAALGQQQLLRWWPVPVVLLFVGLPWLRRHWRIAEPTALPLGWHWAMSAVLILILGWAALQWPGTPLPPATYPHYQDLYFHLALVHELTRTMPFELPQLVGEPLRYHFLSHAHMATSSMVADVSPVLVIMRLWIVPIAAIAAVVTAAVARELSGRWWTGPVSAVVAYLGLSVGLGSAMADSSVSLLVQSPSQTYLMPLFVTLVGLCAAVVRGRQLGPGWALVPAFGLACAGAKLSSLPPLICGLLLAGVAAGLLRRRVPWPTIAALGLLLVAMAVGYPLFAGVGEGTVKVQVFAILRSYAPYNQTLGVDDRLQIGGLLPPGLAAADTAGWIFACSIVAWWLLMQAPRLAGTLLLVTRQGRTDPAAWLLVGTVFGGIGAMWMLQHPGSSQFYFYLGVLPVGALLTTWLLAVARPPWPVPVVAALAGILVDLLVPALPRPAPTRNAWTDSLTTSAARLGAFVIGAALLGLVVAAVLRWRSTGRPLLGRRSAAAVAAASVSAALLGASVAGGLAPNVRAGIAGRFAELLSGRPLTPSSAQARLAVEQEEMAAALWLAEHAAKDDVIATNVHCQPPRTVPNCDARAFWVTGLAGRRTVIESWAYTEGARAAHGRDGRPYARQPAPDADRYALNERVFTVPIRADLERLREEYGVRWLFADTRAGEVSPDLADLARVALVSGPVTVFELS
jgi:hypothetical protein